MTEPEPTERSARRPLDCPPAFQNRRGAAALKPLGFPAEARSSPRHRGGSPILDHTSTGYGTTAQIEAAIKVCRLRTAFAFAVLCGGLPALLWFTTEDAPLGWSTVLAALSMAVLAGIELAAMGRSLRRLQHRHALLLTVARLENVEPSNLHCRTPGEELALVLRIARIGLARR